MDNMKDGTSNKGFTLHRIQSRQDKYFEEAVLIAVEAFIDADPKHVQMFTGGNPTIFEHFVRAFLSIGVKECTVTACLFEDKVAGVISWARPGQETKLTGDPDFQKFWEDLSEEGRDWRIQVFIPKVTSLVTEGFGMELDNLDRYSIEILAVHTKHQGKGIGGKLIRECLEAARNDPRKNGSLACVIATETGVFAYAAQGMKIVMEVDLRSPWTPDGLKHFAMIKG